MQRLEKQHLLESQSGSSGERLHRLTETACLHVLGGRDPVRCWNRRWDGRWRLVLFDVPEIRRLTRNRLRRYLHSHGFGYLQNSVWITPNPITEERALLSDGPVNVESLLVLEARPCAGETDAEIVAGAWDFTDINQRYAAHAAVLNRRPVRPIASARDVLVFHGWLREEREAWEDVMWRDPLLPECLLPEGYLGLEAWRQRLEEMTKAGKQMRAFRGQ